MVATTKHPRLFYRLLYEHRMERGWTQIELANRMTETSGLPWHASTISRLESESRCPAPETVLTIADALELSDKDRFALFASARRWEKEPSDEQLGRVWAAMRNEIST